MMEEILAPHTTDAHPLWSRMSLVGIALFIGYLVLPVHDADAQEQSTSLDSCFFVPEVEHSPLAPLGLSKWVTPVKVVVVNLTARSTSDFEDLLRSALKVAASPGALSAEVVRSPNLAFDPENLNTMVVIMDRKSRKSSFRELDAFYQQIVRTGRKAVDAAVNVTRSKMVVSSSFSISNTGEVIGAFHVILADRVTEPELLGAFAQVATTTALPQLRYSPCLDSLPSNLATESVDEAMWVSDVIHALYAQELRPGIPLEDLKGALGTASPQSN
jgi:hypothetical protein